MATDTGPSTPGPLPERLGQRFALGDVIGRGTCSEVYRAHDLLLDRDAAVKIFPVADDPRIEREVALMASLDHPSLVPVYDVGSVDGRAFVVMALLEGGSLADRLAGGPLGITETLLAVAAVADALGHVHRAGVLHRDVTPRNVLFDADGRAHLSDFGVAFVADAPRITDMGFVVGSAPYLAPEQVRGGTVGPPADVYALGLVMIEALTGRPAYEGKPVAVARARLERRPTIPAGLDAEVVALLEAMTADDPRARPRADELRVRLRRAALAAETSPWGVRPDGTIAAGTETLRPGFPVVGVAPIVDPAAAPTATPVEGPVAGAAPAPSVGAAPGAVAQDETPRRARRTAAGGLVVAASIGAAVLLAGGVVVASAWTVDRVTAAAPPAATVAPPSAEVVANPGAGPLVGGGSGGGAEQAGGAAGRLASPRRTSSGGGAADRPVSSHRPTESSSTDGGSQTRPSTTPHETSSRTSEPSTAEQASESSPSRPTAPSLPSLPGLPSLPTAPSGGDSTSPTGATTTGSTTTGSTTTGSTTTRSTTTGSTTTRSTTSTPSTSTSSATDGDAGSSSGAGSSSTSRTTSDKAPDTAVDPAVEALGGLFGDR